VHSCNYLHHPAAVAATAASLGLGVPGICMALLHDVIDDTDCRLIKVRTEFGGEIAALVDALTVCRDWGGSIDPIVFKLKLADRLHNLQTIRHLPRARQDYGRARPWTSSRRHRDPRTGRPARMVAHKAAEKTAAHVLKAGRLVPGTKRTRRRTSSSEKRRGRKSRADRRVRTGQSSAHPSRQIGRSQRR